MRRDTDLEFEPCGPGCSCAEEASREITEEELAYNTGVAVGLREGYGEGYEDGHEAGVREGSRIALDTVTFAPEFDFPSTPDYSFVDDDSEVINGNFAAVKVVLDDLTKTVIWLAGAAGGRTAELEAELKDVREKSDADAEYLEAVAERLRFVESRLGIVPQIPSPQI